MKYALKFLTIILILTSCSKKDDKDAAQLFINKLEEKSASYHDISLNVYFLSDLDRDGNFEIIERINRIESAYLGLLNVELDAAFSFDKIYVLENGEYVLSKRDIGRHLELQLSYYERWRKLILNPVHLSDDSRQLIKTNKKLFLEEINFIIGEYEKRVN